jgi:hypothetical protein
MDVNKIYLFYPIDSMRHFTQKEQMYTYEGVGVVWHGVLYLSLVGENTQKYRHRF